MKTKVKFNKLVAFLLCLCLALSLFATIGFTGASGVQASAEENYEQPENYVQTYDTLAKRAVLYIHEPVTYSYVAEESGVYCINYTNVDVPGAEISIAFKTDLDDVDSVAVQGDNFPLYLRKGVEYFFIVTYTGILDVDNSPARATVNLEIDEWQTPTLKPYSDFVYAPVTHSGDIQPINVKAKKGEYLLGLVFISTLMAYQNVTVVAHFGENQVYLTPDNGYAEVINVTSETSMWFTSDYSEEFTVGIGLGDTANVLDPEVDTKITLSGAEQTTRYNLTLTTGKYILALDLPNGVNIRVFSNGQQIIGYGQREGLLVVSAQEGEKLFRLEFEYAGSKEITFIVSVKIASNYYIGLGEENSAEDVTVTKDMPANLTIANVPVGSYYLVVKADFELPWDEEDVYPELTYQFNTDEYASYLNYSYNYYLGYYLVTVKITDEVKTLTISAENDLVYTIKEAYFENMFIGQATDYRVENIELVAGSPVTLMLNDVDAGEYFVLFNGWSGVPEGETISVKVDDSEEITLERNYIYWYGYTGDIEITEESTSITIITTSEEVIVGDVCMEKAQTPIYPLPEEATLNLYEPVTYYYVADDTGFFSLDLFNVDVEDAVYGVTVRTDEYSFDSITVQGENFPLYFEYGKEYYIDICYQGTPYEEDEDGEMIPSPMQATVQIAFEYWTAPTLRACREFAYLPVTNLRNPYFIALDAKAGTYTISLIDIPIWAYFAGATVSVHYGDNLVQLSPANSYTAEITINGEDSIWFTSDFGEYFTIGVAIGGKAEILMLDTPTEVILSATNQIAMFAMEEIEAGEYIIFIFTEEAMIEVTVDGEIVINYGEDIGIFHIVLSDREENITASASLLIEYEGTEEITFTVLVTKA